MKMQSKTLKSDSIDPSVLEELSAALGDDIDEIINDFYSTSEELSKKIMKFALTGRYDAINRAAHTLKSSSAQLGAVKLSEMCRTMEMDSVSHRKEDIKTLAIEINNELENVIRELKKR